MSFAFFGFAILSLHRCHFFGNFPTIFTALLNPPDQLVIALDALWLDQHSALHGPSGDVELLDVRFDQRIRFSFWPRLVECVLRLDGRFYQPVLVGNREA
jgi:hypothetical protein